LQGFDLLRNLFAQTNSGFVEGVEFEAGFLGLLVGNQAIAAFASASTTLAPAILPSATCNMYLQHDRETIRHSLQRGRFLEGEGR
jgi:hypothetical protein